ncbi:hypothetical protein [Halobacillus seohaensis]|uniref:Uncharacterized protein n=1 Tax=Halobacillus seohaensis TaxID=447421 RepID=A0ABW2EJD3_9BACI
MKWWIFLIAILLIISIGANVYQYQSHQDDLKEVKSTDLTAMRGMVTELAMRIGDQDASESEIKAIAVSLNRMTMDLSESSSIYPGRTADYDFYQKTSRTLLTFVSNQSITDMPIQTRDAVFQTIMIGNGSRDAEFIERQLSEFSESR